MHAEEREAAALQPEILTKKPNPSSLITASWKRVTGGEREREREESWSYLLQEI
jgi:hypothetical protein